MDKHCKDCNTILNSYNKTHYCALHNSIRAFTQANTKSFDQHNYSSERWVRERDLAKT
ncbi:hypothetical protein LCGC14_1554670 [marine sediment metagenome]|uniref:Uncharacterized protein n=1 Tax=marine sediment metagenome TaxID=412755 RepID=A0A0F9JAA6_9ZZZZ